MRRGAIVRIAIIQTNCYCPLFVFGHLSFVQIVFLLLFCDEICLKLTFKRWKGRNLERWKGKGGRSFRRWLIPEGCTMHSNSLGIVRGDWLNAYLAFLQWLAEAYPRTEPALLSLPGKSGSIDLGGTEALVGPECWDWFHVYYREPPTTALQAPHAFRI